jgi:hypothetical protein
VWLAPPVHTCLVVSVLPSAWLALAGTCPGRTRDAGKPIATWAPRPTYYLSYLPIYVTLFLPCCAFNSVVLPLLDTTDFAVSRSLFPIDILSPTFRFHGRGYVVGQRHAAGATSSSTAAAARRVADLVGARSARSYYFDVDIRWRSEFSEVSCPCVVKIRVQTLKLFFYKTTSIACMRGKHFLKFRYLLPNLDHECPVPLNMSRGIGGHQPTSS